MDQGAETIIATATDTAGNSHTASQDIIIDTSLPTITIDAINTDNIITLNETLTGIVDAGSTVILTLGDNIRPTILSTSGTRWSYTVIAADITAMGEGAETITATATDIAGNTQGVSRAFTVDTVPPTITIDAITADNIINANEASTTITGTVDTGSTVTLTLGDVDRSASVSGTRWSYTLTPTDLNNMGQGVEVITATATDDSGHEHTISREITVDTSPPTITIDSITTDKIINLNEASTTITGTVDTDSTVILTLGNVDRPTILSASGSRWSYTLTATDLNNMGQGAETITATATDTAGNSHTASQDIIIDTSLPTITIDSITADKIINLSEASTTITGTVDAGSTVTLTLGDNIRPTILSASGSRWSYTLTATDLNNMDQGAETITATATDTAGNSHTASQDIIIDTVLPTITIDSINTDNIITLNETLTGIVDAGSTVILTLGDNIRPTILSTSGTRWSYTVIAADITAMGEGAETITATATDIAGNTQGVSRAFTVDTVPPTITIDAITADNIINANEASTTITGTVDTGSTVTLTLGDVDRSASVSGTRWSYTLTPTDLNNMGQGVEVITATATDDSGHEHTISREITVDTSPPTITIDSITTDKIINLNEASTTITGTVDTDSTVILTLGNVDRPTILSASGSRWSYTLTPTDLNNMGQGAETITATATDTAGNSHTASQDIIIDTSLPTITIDSITADKIINLSEASTTITGTVDAGSTVTLTLGDNIRPTILSASGSRWSYTLTATDLNNMDQGAETITATATDTAGNSHTASQDIIIDTSLPTITIDAINTDNIITLNETLTGIVDAGSTVILTLGDNIRPTILSTSGTRWSYTVIAADITAMGEGAETITATATDIAGNTQGVSRAFTVDTVPPTITIDAITADNIINANEASTTITGTVDTGSTVTLTLGDVDRSASVSGTRWSYTLTPTDLNNMGQGAEIITATATDDSGHEHTISREITVDTSPPTITIDSITTDKIINLNEASTTITGTVDTDSTVILTLGNVDRPTILSASGSRWSYTLTPTDLNNMGQGAETITATATDTAGNSHTASQDIIIDTSLPTITIDSITADKIINLSEASTTITGTVDAGSTVTLTLGDNIRPTILSASGSRWSYTLTATDLNNMDQGAETIIATATDTAGNSHTASQDIIIDTVLPTITIDSINTDNIITLNETLTGIVDAGSTVILTLGDNIRPTILSTSGTRWSYTVIAADITAMGEGAETITATATDIAGNTQGVSRAFTVDTVPPTITIDAITADNIINANEASTTITGTVDTGSTVTLTLGDVDRSASVSGTRWSYTLTPTDLNNMGQGVEVITATATDDSGHEHTISREITVDTSPPTITIDSITADKIINLNEASTTITGTVDTDSTVILTLGNVDRPTILSASGSRWSYTLTPTDLNNMGQGAETITATATDTAGNSHTASQDIIIDTSLPTITIDSITADKIINLSEASTTITGTVDAGSTVTLTLGDNIRPTILSASGSRWSYTLTATDLNNMDQGAETIIATATDTAGNSHTASQDIIIDTVLPTITIDSINTDNIITLNETLTGIVDAGSTVILTLGDNIRPTILSTSGTRWSYTVIAADITAMGEGAETITATATDIAGNTQGVSRAFTVDTVPPTITIDAITADNIINANEASTTITGTVDTGSTVTLTLGDVDRSASVSGTRWSYTLTPTDLNNMGQGAETITATATDDSGHEHTISREITVDTSPPTITIDSITTDKIINLNEASTTITGTVDTDSTVILTLGNVDRPTILSASGSRWSYTLTPTDLNNMGQGAETITATATDTAGNSHTASQDIIIDTSLPTITIDSITADKIINLSEASTTITGTVDAGSTVTLTLGDNIRPTILSASGSRWSYTLTATDLNNMDQGAETITATATDTAGNSHTASQDIIIDTSLPTITIDAINTDNIITLNETLTGIVDAGSTVILTLGDNIRPTILSTSGTRWSYTVIAADITAMGEGAETITATATDIAGNTQGVSRAFTVDTVPPTITIDAITADNIINANEASTTITGTVDTGSTVTLTLGDVDRSASVSGTRWSYTLTPTDLNNMDQGAEVITATATDTAGNTQQASHTFAVDTIVPTITITAMTINANLAPITGTVEAGSTVKLRFSNEERDAIVTGTSWTYDLTDADITAMDQGAEVITATATDTAGNTQQASHTFAVDTIVPTITITAMIINANLAPLTGTVEAGSTVSLNLGNMDRAATVTGDTWHYNLLQADITAMEQGTETITATATDSAGNKRTTSREITVDTVLPTIAINDITADNIINLNEVTTPLTGTVEAGSTVKLRFSNEERDAIVSGTSWSYTLTPTDLNNIGQGAETITATATDTAGNTQQASHTFAVDTIVPTITITTTTINANLAPITGTVEAGSTVSLNLGNNIRTATVTGDIWHYNLRQADITAMEQGTETITATATDTAGNKRTATQEITVDTVLPTVTIHDITDDNIINSNEATTSITITGMVETGSTVSLNLGDVDRPTTLSVSGTRWSYTLTSPEIRAMSEGTNTITATATDTAGNTHTVSHEFTVDTDLLITINAIAADDIIHSNEVTTSITGMVDAGSTVTLNLGRENRPTTVTGSIWSYTLTPTDLNNMGQGAETITATAIDTAGNERMTTREINVDTQIVTIVTARDDVSIHNSFTGDLITGASTDDTTPTLIGTLSMSLTSAAQMLAIYDNHGGITTKLGNATVTGKDWAYTPSELPVGSHSFTARVENPNGQQSSLSNTHVVNINSGISIMEITDDLGAITGIISSEVRYILLKQTGASTNELSVSEVEVFSDGVNVALGKTVTAGENSVHDRSLPSGVTDGSRENPRANQNAYASNVATNDNWLLIDLGAFYQINSIKLYAYFDFFTSLEEIRDLAIFGSKQDLSSQSYVALTTDPNAIFLGTTGSSPTYLTTPDIHLTNDDTPILSGILTAALVAGEELAIYDSTTLADSTTLTKKLGVATVNRDNSWSFTPMNPLADGGHTLKAVIQAAGEIAIAKGRVISSPHTINLDASITTPTQIATIDTVFDDVNTHGSVRANLAMDESTDDTTPTLSGTLSAALTRTQVLAIYDDDGDGDGPTKIGEATITGTSWAFTPPFDTPLTAGSHRFTARVDSPVGGLGAASTAYEINIHSGIDMIITSDVSTIMEDTYLARYILLKQTGTATSLRINEVQVFSNGVNIAEGKTVTVGGNGLVLIGFDPSGITDGTLLTTRGHAYVTLTSTTDNWLLIDLGANYNIDSVNVYAFDRDASSHISNVDIFATSQDLSHLSHNLLSVHQNAFNLGGTGATPEYKTTLTSPLFSFSHDDTPTLSGTLTAALGADEELAIYIGIGIGIGSVKQWLGVASVNADNSWIFTTNSLANGNHSFSAVIQAIGETTIAKGRVISALNTITVVLITNTVTIVTVSDDVHTHRSAIGNLMADESTDDTTPTLTGTLSALLTTGDVVAIYDNHGDGATKLGEATVTGAIWTYTPSALIAGKHSFTARIESSNGGLSKASNAYVVNLHSGIDISVTADTGTITAVIPKMRYILLKQTGDSTNRLWLNEVEVFSDGVNVALGKTVTAGENNVHEGFVPSGITDGSLLTTIGHGYASNMATNNNWLLIDLGISYSIDSIKVYAFSGASTHFDQSKNLDIFVSNRDYSSQTYDMLTTDPNIINLGGTGSIPSYTTTLTSPVINVTDDTTPILSGLLTTALGTSGIGEELAIYHGTTKMGIATVSGDNTWSFTPTNALADGNYRFTAVIQAVGETAIANGRVISAQNTIAIVSIATIATIETVSDDVSTYDSAVGPLAAGVTTDDTTPTLAGALSATLTTGQVLVIYDGDDTTKLGEATVTGTSWAYTPSALTAGSYGFTARVENSSTNQQSSLSSIHVVNVNSGISMTVTDNEGTVTGVLSLAMRYILLKQTGDSTNKLFVNEVEVFSGGVNIAEGKTVTAGYHYSSWRPSGVTDGSLIRDFDGFASNVVTNDNWLLIDLGAFYHIDSVNVYALSAFDLPQTRNIDIFASRQDISHQTYDMLTADPNIIHLGGTGSSPAYKTSLTTPPVTTITDDTTPTLSGTLTLALVAGEELAIYHNNSKLTVITVNDDNTWTFTTNVLADGSHTFKAVIQAAGETAIAKGRVISAASTIIVDSSLISVTIETVTDDVSTHGSVVGALATGATTDDTTPALAGTLSVALTSSQVLAIYDDHGGSTTKLGQATITGTSWAYTPSALPAGSHRFTARVEDSANSLQRTENTAHVVNLHTGIDVSVTDDLGIVMRDTPEARYILLKQTGDSTTPLRVNEVEVFSDGVNIAEGKTVTAGDLDIAEGFVPSGVTSGSLLIGAGHAYFSNRATTDNWLLIDLGAFYHIDSVNVYAFSTAAANLADIRNLDIFASKENLSSQTHDMLTNAPNAINLGGTGSTPEYKTSLTSPIISLSHDNTPTLSGTLTAALVADEELAIYDGSTKLGVVTVNSDNNAWRFTTSVLTDGAHRLKAVIQAKGETNITKGFVISAQDNITIVSIPTTVTIATVTDDVGTHGSAVGPLAIGATTDDTTPTLMGTLSAELTYSQVLAIYDNHGDSTTKLGEATVTGTGWTYTPSALTIGSHSFTARIESLANSSEPMASTPRVVNINPSISMSVTDDVGIVTGIVTPGRRYILLKQTDVSTNPLRVNEVEVFSGGVNVALGKTVTAGESYTEAGFDPSGVTDGNLGAYTAGQAYSARLPTSDNWLLIDLGAFYQIDSVNLYALEDLSNRFQYLRNLAVFASSDDLSRKSHKALTDDPNAIHLGGTGFLPGYKTTLAKVVDVTDDSTPTLSGTLTLALVAGEELAIYDGSTKLAVVTTVNNNNSWRFTTPVLSDGVHALKAVIQAIGATDITKAFVISATHSIKIEASVTIVAMRDDVSIHNSFTGDLVSGASTDDTTPTLIGTLSTALTTGQVLAIYDNHGDSTTRLGDATVTGTSWTYAPSELTPGSHSFTAQIKDPSGRQSLSTAHVVNISPSISMSVNDDRGIVTGVTPQARYILLKQTLTGESTNRLWVNEVEVFSDAVDVNGVKINIAEGKTVTAGSYHIFAGFLPSGITDGTLMPTAGSAYSSAVETKDNWLRIDLGAFYHIDSVNVYAFSTRAADLVYTSNLAIFASQHDLSHKSYNNLLNDRNAINLGGTGASPAYKTTLVSPVITNDSTPTLSGTLTLALVAGEELAIYDGMRKLGVATVNSDTLLWTFTTSVLSDGLHPFKAVIQAVAETNIANGRVISAENTITVDSNLIRVTIDTVHDDASIHDSVMGNLVSGASTDDTTPTLTGTLSAALTSSQVLAIYDDHDGSMTKLGDADVAEGSTSWTYTPSVLPPGRHSFTARVDDSANNPPRTDSAVHVVNIYSDIEMIITDDAGIETGITPQARYILLKQTGPRSGTLAVSEVEVFSDGVNVALGKNVLGQNNSAVINERFPSGITDGSLAADDSYFSSIPNTVDNWLLIDLGASYLIERVNLYAFEDNFIGRSYIRDLAVFASNKDLSALDYADLQDNANAINLGGTGGSPSYKTSLATHVITDDQTPTLSGTLITALGADEELAIYDGTTLTAKKLGVATVSNNNAWTFTTNPLAEGTYAFKAVIQVVGETAITKGLVISTANTITIDVLPTQTATIETVSDNENTQGGFTGNLVSGVSTDDTTPTLAGTLSAGLTAGQVLAIYDDHGDSTTRLGEATVTGRGWSYTPSALPAGSYSFTAQVESPFGALGTVSSAHMVNLHSGIDILVTSDAGLNRGVVAPGATTSDNTPTLSGTLTAALGTSGIGEELAIYDSARKLGVAIVNSDNTWEFTPTVALTGGLHTLKAVIQATGNLDIRQDRVISATSTITVDTRTAIPTQTATIVTVNDDVSTHDSFTGALASGASTDDTTPTLMGTLSAGLTSGQVLAIYDDHGGITTKLGEANVALAEATATGRNWFYIHSVLLTTGSHRFTARVESLAGFGAASNAHVVNVHSGISMSVTDDVGVDRGVLASGATTDDSRPTLSGTLPVALVAGEELAIYNDITKLGVADVNSDTLLWTFTPTKALANSSHALKAVIQATGNSNIRQGRVISATSAITVEATPVQALTILTVKDDVSTHGSVIGNVVSGTSTDDTTPTLTGTLSAPLSTPVNPSVLSIYDGEKKITSSGDAARDRVMVNPSDNTWTYTLSSPLTAGSHSFTARLEDHLGRLSEQSTAHVINIHNGIDIKVTDDVGDVQGVITPRARYILLKQTGDSALPQQLWLNEVEVFSGGVNVAKGKTVTSGSTPFQGFSLADVTDGILGTGGLILTPEANDHWLLIDLVDSYNINSVNVYAFSDSAGHFPFIENVDIFATKNDLSGLRHDQLIASRNAIRLGGTGSSPSYKTSLTATVTTDDNTPSLFGTLTAPLGVGEELVIYKGTKVSNQVASVNDDKQWRFIITDPLDDGTHTFRAAIQAIGKTDITEARVISTTITITVDTGVTAASTQGAQAAAAPQEAIYSSFASSLEARAETREEARVEAIVTMQAYDNVGALTGKISAGTDTDDSTVRLTGTVTGFDTDGAVWIYDGEILLDDATIGSTVAGVTNWSYTLAALEIGSHTIAAFSVDGAGARNSANNASTTFTVTATDTSFSAIATTDPISGMSVQTYSLASTAMDQTLDFSGDHPEINVVNIAGSGANTVKIQLDDVLQSGINLFNDANGWVGLVGAGKHQLVVNGDADDTLVLDSMTQVGSWIKEGTTTNSDHTYLVYSLDSGNVNGVSQVLVDIDMIRDGAIL